MKLSTKPISSPGRTEKFPPPLMRFLRTNVGSKSRGRSRSSPMFVRKKNTPSAIETQEPSSPKVTCMGQVRVRRSSKQASSTKPTKARRTGTPAPAGCRCRWIPRALFCRHFAGKLSPKLCRPVWSKWASYFQVSFRRKVETREEEPSKLASRLEEKNEDSEEEDEDEEDEKEEAKVFVSSCSPPKNALLLTRCRSAPYRSSSLASRFWGSPLKPEEEVEQSAEVENRDECSKYEKPKSEMESLDPETEEKLQLFREFDGSNGKIFSESANTDEEEESKTGEGDLGFGRPLILTRCKSEPARTGEKLDPELSFWKNRRLGIVNSCSPSVL